MLRASKPNPVEVRTAETEASRSLAVDTLYESYAARLRRVVARRIGDEHLAEDIVQETFLRVHRNRDLLDPERPPWPWLRTIALRLAANARRPMRVGNEDLIGEPTDVERVSNVDGAADPAEHRMFQAALIDLLANIPDRERRLLVRRDMFEMGYDELADAEGMTAATLRVTSSRAGRLLRGHQLLSWLEGVAPVGGCLRTLTRRWAWFKAKTSARWSAWSPAAGPAFAPVVGVVAVLGSVAAISAGVIASGGHNRSHTPPAAARLADASRRTASAALHDAVAIGAIGTGAHTRASSADAPGSPVGPRVADRLNAATAPLPPTGVTFFNAAPGQPDKTDNGEIRVEEEHTGTVVTLNPSNIIEYLQSQMENPHPV